jgi:Ca2+-binding RTX toxin-like protein
VVGNAGDDYIVANYTVGTDDDDSVSGDAGNDTITGAQNSGAIFSGDGGTDTFIQTQVAFTTFSSFTGFEVIDLRSANFAHSLTVTNAYVSSLVNTTLTVTAQGNTTAITVNGSGVSTAANKLNITGSNNNDTLTGGAGADTLQGGIGVDSMTGGTNADVFTYTAATESGIGAGNRDIITDFVAGTDDINLAAFAGTFTFRAAGNGIADFTGGVMQVAWQQTGGNTIVFVDSDGNNATDFEIQLTGTLTLTSSDFVL